MTDHHFKQMPPWGVLIKGQWGGAEAPIWTLLHNLMLTVAMFAQVGLCPCGPFHDSRETLEMVFEYMDTLCAGIHDKLSMELKLPDFDLSGLVFIAFALEQ